jgi:hypothetical protein
MLVPLVIGIKVLPLLPFSVRSSVVLTSPVEYVRLADRESGPKRLAAVALRPREALLMDTRCVNRSPVIHVSPTADRTDRMRRIHVCVPAHRKHRAPGWVAVRSETAEVVLVATLAVRHFAECALLAPPHLRES